MGRFSREKQWTFFSLLPLLPLSRPELSRHCLKKMVGLRLIRDDGTKQRPTNSGIIARVTLKTGREKKNKRTKRKMKREKKSEGLGGGRVPTNLHAGPQQNVHEPKGGTCNRTRSPTPFQVPERKKSCVPPSLHKHAHLLFQTKKRYL